MFRLWRDVWRYRGFVASTIRNEFRLKYARSRLGLLWMALSPLAQAALFAFILSSVLSTRLPGIESEYAYAIYLMSGMLAWSLFAEIFGRCLNIFLDNGHLLKKVQFPKITLPVIAAGGALAHNVMLLVAIVIIFGAFGHLPLGAIAWLVPLTLLNLAFGLALGLVFGTINVFARDWSQVAPILLQFWFWCTPVVYPESILPAAFRAWLPMNPLYPLVNGYHRVLVYGDRPELQQILPLVALSLALASLALFLFRRARDEIVEAL
jgi:lipopolysaccharide transport system permease protein